MREIYFDCAATVPPFEEALKTFSDVSRGYFGNSASNHALGLKAANMLSKARGQVAKYLGVQSEEIIFTSGASESNNLAIKGIAYHNRGWANRIITSAAEHPSVSEVFKQLSKEGFEVIYIGYDKMGRLDLEQLKGALNERTSLVSIMAVNNELGYIFPIKEIRNLVHSNSKAVFHTDATQAISKAEISAEDYDLMSFSAHKIGGLKGSGVLVRKKHVPISSQILGGSQEDGLRAGTSALGLDCALATALRLALSTQEARKKKAAEVNAYLRGALSEIDEVVLTSPEGASPFILGFALSRHKGSVIAEALSNEGIFVSTKSACSSREAGYSTVLHNAGFSDTIAYNGIRLSFCGSENIEDAAKFISSLKCILSEIKA